MPAKFVLVGSGLAGGLLAAYLGRRGYDVDLYERRTDPREGNFVGGRSINLAISTRGIHALEQIGIADEALRHAIPMRGRMIHDKSGALHFAAYDVDPRKCINSIGRATLNAAVIKAAQRYPNVHVYFNHKCTDVDLAEAACHLETETGKVTVRGDAVIGVDGAFSAVRASMQRNIDNFQYDENYLAHGVKWQIHTRQRGFEQMIEFLFRAKCPRRGFVAHFKEITDRQIGERIGIFFSGFEIFGKSAFAVIGKFVQALVEHDAIFERGVHSLAIKWNHCVGGIAEQADPVTVIPGRATNRHK